jgi:hypothetical protein
VNTNAAFDFADVLVAARTLSEVIALSNVHARTQFEALSQQSKELSALARQLAVEAAEAANRAEPAKHRETRSKNQWRDLRPCSAIWRSYSY